MLHGNLLGFHWHDCLLGMQGYMGNNSSSTPLPGIDSGNDMYILAKKMALERQRSLPNPYSYWPGRDSTSMLPKSEVISETTTPHAKLLSAIAENPRLLAHPQGADLLSVIQGIADRPASALNNGVPAWSNFPSQGGLEPLQDKIDLHQAQNFATQTSFGIQQQRLTAQSPPLTSLLGQAIDNNPASVLTPEKLVSSALSQDLQSLSILQQQLLLQLHSQPSLTTQQQLLLLDKVLLLKQQQKQEEQQQLLRQQQLLSQVLSEHHSHQRLNELPYGQLQATAVSTGNATVDPRLQPPQEMFQIGKQIPVPSIQDERSANFVSLPHVTQDVSYSVSSEASSSYLPHNMFGNINRQPSWETTLPEKIDDINQESFPASMITQSMPSVEVMSKISEESSLSQKHAIVTDFQAPVSLEQKSEVTWKTDKNIMVEQSVGASNSVTSEVPKISASGLNPEICKDEVSMCDVANDVKVKPEISVVKNVERETNKEPSTMIPATEVKNVEVREVRKTSEKKSRKQKSNKQSSEQPKSLSKTSSLQQPKQSETEGLDLSQEKFEAPLGGEVSFITSPKKIKDNKSENVTVANIDSQHGLSSITAVVDVEAVEEKGEQRLASSISLQSTQLTPGHRAWKPAPGFKARSLLEIQQEEQKKAQTDLVVSEISTAVSSTSLSTPWAGVVANSEPKAARETRKEAGITESNVGKLESTIPKGKKSPLHDLLAEEVLAKSNEREIEVPDIVSSEPYVKVTTIQAEVVDDDNFIEAKETKKSRKKSAKAKGTGAKVSMAVTSADVAVSTSPIEKSRSARLVQQEKEVLPAIPSGPSLGDFVLWKGEPASPSVAPAWSNDSKKFPKPTSLRDIQKEQEKKTSSIQPSNPIPTPQKSPPTQTTHGSGMSSSLSASSPSKAASPIQINSHISLQSKYRGDDDLFWGPIEQSRQETKKYDTYLNLLNSF